MKTIQVSETTDLQIDWLVAKCKGLHVTHYRGVVRAAPVPNTFAPEFTPSTSWGQAGPIIEREEISIKHVLPAMRDSIWQAFPSLSAKGAGGKWGVGPTPLIAAMRCYIASKLGDVVEVPEGL